MDAVTVDRFRAILADRFGLAFDEARLPWLEDLLIRRAGSVDRLSSYLAREVTSQEELRILAREITVPETYFFRHADSFRALMEDVVPDRMRARGTTRTLRLLSAGCASGEEPYSLAMLLADHADAGWTIEIDAFDINTAAITKAKHARYTQWALRETPAELEARWFVADGNELVVPHRIRSMVRFSERNLVDDDPASWQAGTYDIVFCRNVVMYFLADATRAAIARLARALVPGGCLFLGHAETLRGISNDFHLRHSHGAFFYEKRDDDSPREVDSFAERVDRASPKTAPSPPQNTAWTESWIETVRRSSERIAMLASPKNETPPPRKLLPSDIAKVIELVHEERFAEAKAIVDALPPDTRRDPDVLLVHAVLLTHGGDLDEAHATCVQLLALDGWSAGAHYLLALCRENAGDSRAAIEHDQLATYIDPTFAMPRFHLGLLARRAGRVEEARRELSHAIGLLEREDASRVLLYGGGFAREALVATCRSQLRSCGGAP